MKKPSEQVILEKLYDIYTNALGLYVGWGAKKYTETDLRNRLDRIESDVTVIYLNLEPK
jgi:hypothetical protein